jgi:hypothetical protein
MLASIANDAKRTTGQWRTAEPHLTAIIQARVTNEALIRMFLVFAHQTLGTYQYQCGMHGLVVGVVGCLMGWVLDWEPRPSYAQGMNNLAGLLLFNMPEADAFYCMMRLFQWHFLPYSVVDYRLMKVSSKVHNHHHHHHHNNIRHRERERVWYRWIN